MLTNFDVPEVDTLLGGLYPPDWMRTRCEQLRQSPDPLDHVVAMGFVGRLGPGATLHPREVLQGLIDGTAEAPSAIAERWLDSLDGSIIDEVFARWLGRVDRLWEDLESLDETLAEEGEVAARALRSVSHQRDDIESVAWVLRRSVRADLVPNPLAAIDALRPVAGAELDDLLGEVNWQEPHAWWGQVSMGQIGAGRNEDPAIRRENH